MARKIYGLLFPPHTRRSLLFRKHVMSRLQRSAVATGGLESIRSKREGATRARVLLVFHEAPGGVELTTRDLIAGINKEFSVFTLRSDSHCLKLEHVNLDGDAEPVGSWWYGIPWSGKRLSVPLAAAAYREILSSVQPDLVHMRHLMGHTTDLLSLCREADIPVVFSVHDFFLACPTTHLLDQNGHFCGGTCSAGSGRCISVMPWTRDFSRFKGSALANHRAQLVPHLESVAVWITTSVWVREIMTRVYPEMHAQRWEIIEHGRDFPDPIGAARVPQPGRPIQMISIGHLGPHKGETEMLRLMRYDAATRNRLRLAILGTCSSELGRFAEVTGPFNRDDLPNLVARFSPSFSLLLSPWGETYSHALTESWSVGVPALVPDIGTLAERVRRHGGGWIVPDTEPEGLLRFIEEISGHGDEYRRQVRLATTDGLPSTTEMCRRYAGVYHDVLTASPAQRPVERLHEFHDS